MGIGLGGQRKVGVYDECRMLLCEPKMASLSPSWVIKG